MKSSASTKSGFKIASKSLLRSRRKSCYNFKGNTPSTNALNAVANPSVMTRSKSMCKGARNKIDFNPRENMWMKY